MNTRVRHDTGAYNSMDEALAEIRRLRDEVRHLREELNDPLAGPAVGEQAAAPADAGEARPDAAAPEAPSAGAPTPEEAAAASANEWIAPDPQERAALERLERLREAITHVRAERERAVQELRSLVQPILLPDAPAPRPGADTAPATAARPDQRLAPLAPATMPPAEPPAVDAPAPPAAHDRAPEDRRVIGSVPGGHVWSPRQVVGLVAAALVVAFASFLFFALRTGQDGAPVPTGAPGDRPRAAGPAPGDAPAGPAAPGTQGTQGRATDVAPGSGVDRPGPASAPTAAPIRVELRTERESWLRVTVDGERRFERLVPAGEVFVLDGASAISVRAGDAGAVTVSVNGAPPAVMGRDGQVIDRTFEAAPQPAR
jgi:hypothetical protein